MMARLSNFRDIYARAVEEGVAGRREIAIGLEVVRARHVERL